MKSNLESVFIAVFVILAVFLSVACEARHYPPPKYKVGDHVRFVLKPSVEGIVMGVDESGHGEPYSSYRVQYVESETPGVTRFASNRFTSGELQPSSLVGPRRAVVVPIPIPYPVPAESNTGK